MRTESEAGIAPTQAAAARHKPMKPFKIIFAVLALLAVTGIAYSAMMRRYVGLYYVPSEAMEPTLMGHDAGPSASGVPHADSVHDHILIDKRAYRSRAPQAGDIIVFTAPKAADAEHKYSGVQVENTLVKRVVGLPGDTIEIKNGRVYRNGKPLKEPYIKEPMDPNLEPNFVFGTPTAQGDTQTPGGAVHLGPGRYRVMGDNRNDSNDSRYWGALEGSRIVGKVTSIVAPPGRERSFP